MTSLFNSAVRERREHTPWAEIVVKDFLSDLAIQASDGERAASLQVWYRHSVASLLWWSLTWTGADGEEHCAEAQTLELCLWRAAEMELRGRSQEQKKVQDTLEELAGKSSPVTLR